jgi:mercuric reductase
MGQIGGEDRYDLAIIGSGGAAFAAAIAARRKDKLVVMVERATIGGTCVNTGCVPSKALLAAAEARHLAIAQSFPGIATDAGPVDLPALLAGKQALVQGLRADKYVDLAAAYGWEVVAGQAHFVPGTTADGGGPALQVDLASRGIRRIQAAHHLIATGSSPWTPPIQGLDEVGYLTSTTAMELDELPRSLLVIGGNAVGLEQAQLFARLGTKVTVVELEDRLAPLEEPEVGATIAAVLADEGITVHTNAQVTRVTRDTGAQEVVATLRHRDGHPQELRAERLLVATGRRPVTDGLNLEAVGVKVGDRGQVVVDEQLRTHNPRIWAAGDVTGHPQFVYVAAAHGTLAADNALDRAGRTLDYRHLPRVIFTSPQIAAVGLTDAQAAQQGIACACRVLPLEHVPRALVDRDTRGLVKIVAERPTGRVLGVSMVADRAGNAILAAVYAVKLGMTVGDLADTWAPYLTIGEGLKLAAQAFTREVAKLSCCAA